MVILEYYCSYYSNGNDGNNDLMTDGMYHYVSGCDVDNAYEQWWQRYWLVVAMVATTLTMIMVVVVRGQYFKE